MKNEDELEKRFNRVVDDLKNVSVLRSVFSDQLSYGMKGLKIIKLSNQA